MNKKIKTNISLIACLFILNLTGCSNTYNSTSLASTNRDSIARVEPKNHGHFIEPRKNEYENIIECDLDNPILLKGNEKKCLISNNGQYVITRTYQDLQVNEFSLSGLIAVKLQDKWGFINGEGQEIIAPTYDDFRIYSDGIVSIKQNEKFGFIDANGKVIFEPKYDATKRLMDGTSIVMLNGKKGFINKDFQIIVEPKYDNIPFDSFGIPNNPIKISLNGKQGYIDINGNEIIPPIYDFTTDESEKFFLVRYNKKWGYVKKGNIVAVPIEYPSEYKAYLALKEYQNLPVPEYLKLYDEVQNFDTKDNISKVVLNGLYGCIDSVGNEIIPPIYQEIEWLLEDNYLVKLNDKWGYISKEGEVIIPIKYATDREAFFAKNAR